MENFTTIPWVQFVANFIFVLVLIGKFYFENKNNKTYREKDIEIHDSLVTAITNQGEKLEAISVFLREASSGYTRTVSYSTAKELASTVFTLAKYKIERTVLEMLGDLNWNNEKVREKFYHDISIVVCNVYEQDAAFMGSLDYNKHPLSYYMDKEWIDVATETCNRFVTAHFERGNHFDLFRRSLDSDFIRFHNDFIKSLNPLT